MPSLGIAPHPGGLQRVLVYPAAGAGTGLQASFRQAATLYAFRELGFRQSSFRHITRASRRTAPYAWARPPVSWHALFPEKKRRPLRVTGKPSGPGNISSNPCPLYGQYDSAPRGAHHPLRSGKALSHASAIFTVGGRFPFSIRLRCPPSMPVTFASSGRDNPRASRSFLSCLPKWLAGLSFTA
jgi:hypothetical protein